jgi:hypothetical protein
LSEKTLMTGTAKKEENLLDSSCEGDQEKYELVTCEIYRKTFRRLLAAKMAEIQGMSFENAEKLVIKLLPDKNFFFFKAGLRDADRKRTEKLEIKKLIYDILTDSSAFMCETPELLKPPLRDFGFIKNFFDYYNAKINFV